MVRKAGSLERAAVDLLYPIAQAGSGGPCTEQAGLAYKVPAAAYRKTPHPSAATRRAVGPQPIKSGKKNRLTSEKYILNGLAIKCTHEDINYELRDINHICSYQNQYFSHKRRVPLQFLTMHSRHRLENINELTSSKIKKSRYFSVGFSNLSEKTDYVSKFLI